MENKYGSRKFIVWISALAIVITTIIITKTVPDSVINMFAVISSIYLGSNSFVNWVRNKDGTNK